MLNAHQLLTWHLTILSLFFFLAKHNFYTPRYYRALKTLVNSWPAAVDGAADNDEEWTVEDLQVLVEMAMDGAALTE